MARRGAAQGTHRGLPGPLPGALKGPPRGIGLRARRIRPGAAQPALRSLPGGHGQAPDREALEDEGLADDEALAGQDGFPDTAADSLDEVAGVATDARDEDDEASEGAEDDAGNLILDVSAAALDEDLDGGLDDAAAELDIVAVEDAPPEAVAALTGAGPAPAMELQVESLIAELDSGKPGRGRGAAQCSTRRRLEDYLEQKRMARDLEDLEDFDI